MSIISQQSWKEETLRFPGEEGSPPQDSNVELCPVDIRLASPQPRGPVPEYTPLHTHPHTHAHTPQYPHLHTHKHTYRYTHTPTHMHTPPPKSPVYTHTRAHMWVHNRDGPGNFQLWQLAPVGTLVRTPGGLCTNADSGLGCELHATLGVWEQPCPRREARVVGARPQLLPPLGWRPGRSFGLSELHA